MPGDLARRTRVSLPYDRPRPPVPQYLRETTSTDPTTGSLLAKAAAQNGASPTAVALAAVAAVLGGRTRTSRIPLAVAAPETGPGLRAVTVDAADPLAAVVALATVEAALAAAAPPGQEAGVAVLVLAEPGGAGPSDLDHGLADRDLVLTFTPEGPAHCSFDRDLYEAAGVDAFCADVGRALQRLLDSPDLPLVDDPAALGAGAPEEEQPHPGPEAAQAPARALTPTERALAEVWAEVLGTDAHHIDAASDFFALGGHSLLAARAAMRAGRLLGVEIAVEDVFRAPTLGELAVFVDQGARAPLAPSIPPAPQDGPLPLAPSQSGIWYAEQAAPGTSRYHVPIAWELTGQVDPDALRRALEEVIERHEPLRTAVLDAGGSDGPRQSVLPPGPAPLTVHDLTGTPTDTLEAAVDAVVTRTAATPFDLAAAPLRAALATIAPDRHVLVLVVHHLVCDQWSLARVVRDLCGVYRAPGGPGPAPSLRFADWVHWQGTRLTGRMPELTAYWAERTATAPSPPIPGARPRTAATDRTAGTLRFDLPAGLVASLHTLAQECGTTLFTTLYTGFLALLHRSSGERDIAVGTSVAGRDHPALEDLVGSFVNMVLLRTEVDPGLGFRDLARQARTTVLDAYTHQDYPLQEALRGRRERGTPGPSPLSSVVFELLSVDPVDLDLPQVRAREIPVRAGAAKYDLLVTLQYDGPDLYGIVEYDTGVLDHPAAERLAADYAALLRAVADDPDRRIDTLPAPAAAPPTVPTEPVTAPPTTAEGEKADDQAHLTPLLAVLERVWAEELGRDSVGVHDNFFDLGGYSLSATRVLARLRDMLAVRVPLRVMIGEGTVAALAAHIESHVENASSLDRAVRVARIMQAGEGCTGAGRAVRDQGLPS